MLVDHAGWKRLMEIAEGQLQIREPEATAPLENLLMVGLKERKQGEVDGIKFFMAMPGVRIKDIRKRLDELDEEIENDDEQGQSPTAGGTSDDGGEFERPSP